MGFNLGQVNETIAAALTKRECIVYRDRRLTYTDVAERSRRLGQYLLHRGVTVHRERSDIENWESGQDHVALLMYNGNEYLESMLGCFKTRAVPLNINYRYVAEELRYVLRDATVRGIIYHASLAELLSVVLPDLDGVEVLIQVNDEPGCELLPGAVEYEAALAASSAETLPTTPSPDDLYILYTGGTTGMPKGVLWRQADVFDGAFGTRGPDGSTPKSIEDVVAIAQAGSQRSLPTSPFMHGAAHWFAFFTMHTGGTVVIPPSVRRFDADAVWDTVEAERVTGLNMVGDAFGGPLLEALATRDRDLASLMLLANGGAALNPAYKQAFLSRLPGTFILDSMGTSESGIQGSNVSSADTAVSSGDFRTVADTVVLSEDRRRLLSAGDHEIGWMARCGPLPLGYLGDPKKTKETFPVVNGVRYSVPGDRARVRADGSLEFLGRDAVTINSGGEKIFAEEVENAIRQHPDIVDAVVVGRPSERWGQEVVAIVQRRDANLEPTMILEECGKHVARYKHPKHFVFVDEVRRSPAGKPDYRWAAELAKNDGNRVTN